MATDVKLTEDEYVRFADGKGKKVTLVIKESPAVKLKRIPSGRNTVSPLNVVMENQDPLMEMDNIPCKKRHGNYNRTLAMLSRGKGASIFEAVELGEEEEVGMIDKEILNAKDNEGFTFLHHAARCNKPEKVIGLLDQGTEIDILGNQGLTALHIAVRHKSTEAVKVLLQKGADPSIPDEELETPLSFAARRGYKEIVALLLQDPRTEVNCANSAKFTPFHAACGSGDRSLVEMLLKHGADLTAKTSNLTTALHFTAFNANTDICELLISSATKTCPSLKNFLDEKDVEDTTALHICCRKGCYGVAELLLRHGADYEAVTGVNFSTPLHLTAMYGHEDIAMLLLASGAAISSKDGQLQTPLHRAAAFDRIKIAQILLDNGADKEDKDMMDLTSFLTAVIHGAKETSEMLLDQGANIMAVDSESNSCLHLAVKYKYVASVKMLMARGKEQLMELRNNELKTVMHIAASNQQREILDILLEEDFLVEQRDINERIPLHLAAENGSLECVESLLRCETRYIYGNDRDKEGMSPLHLAASKKHVETCVALIKKGSDVTALNNYQCTPLHLAVKVGSLETVRLLLNPMLPNTLEVKDQDQNTPLHIAGMHNRVEILKFLLDQGADVTARNNKNMTCLDEAIEWNSVEVAETLVGHKRWKEVVCNTPKDQITPIEKLIAKLPDVAETVLDQCISYSDLPTTHPDFTVTCNFVPLDPSDDSTSHRHFFGPACMAKYRRESLLNHSVTQLLLRWKWLVLGKYINYLNFAVFVAFLILFSVFIVQERDKVNFSNDNGATTEAGDESTGIPGVIFAFLIVSLFKEIFQMFWLRLEYFRDYTNFLDLCMYTSCFIYILPYVTKQDLYGDVRVQWTAGTSGLLLGYINWCLALRRVTSVALYVTMYIEVLLTFVKVILVFVVVLVGYTLVFYVLLKEEDTFSSVWFSMVKIFVMMVGEMDYTDILSDNVVNSAKVPGTDILYVPFPELSYVMFALFVLSVPVVLMNLLVGLAVGDIDSIQKTATLRTLMDQALLVDSIQKRYPKFLLRLGYKESMEFKPNQNTFIKRFAFSGTGLSDNEFLDIISKKDSSQNKDGDDLDDYDQQRIERQEKQIKNLQDAVDAQGELLRAIADKLNIS